MARYFRYYKNINTLNRVEARAGYVNSQPKTKGVNEYVYRLYDIAGTPTPSGYVNGRAYKLGSPHVSLSGPAYARAYDSFWRQVSGGVRAALGITLIEWRSSLAMIAEAAASLWQAAKAFRKGDFYNAFRLLGVRTSKKATKKLRDKYDRGWKLSDLWLELNFGWAPLYEDIYRAIQVFGQEVPTRKITTRARESLEFSQTGGQGTNWRTWSYGLGYRRIQLGGNIVAVNPNILLLKQLGLTNPAQVAWDVVPFSFVIDWFLPVNKFLGSLDSQLGVTVADLYASWKVYVEGQDGRFYPPDPNLNFSWSSKFIDFQRRQMGSLPLPKFADRMPDF